MSDKDVSIMASCVVIIALVAFLVGISAGMGFLTMIVLGAVGVHWSFWTCWAVWILVSCVFGGSRK